MGWMCHNDNLTLAISSNSVLLVTSHVFEYEHLNELIDAIVSFTKYENERRQKEKCDQKLFLDAKILRSTKSFECTVHRFLAILQISMTKASSGKPYQGRVQFSYTDYVWRNNLT